MMISNKEKPSSNGETSGPESSQVRYHQDPERIRKFYVAMPDATMLIHVRAVLEEIAKRPDLDIPIPVNVPDVPVEPEFVPIVEEMIDPKTELADEAYIEVHPGSRGIEYNWEDDSYSWNHRFAGNQRDTIRRVNELNEYGRRRRRQIEEEEKGEETEQTAVSRSPSPPPPVKRNSRVALSIKPKVKGKKPDLPVACKCSICSADFTSITSLLDHRRDAHSEKVMLQCGICRKMHLSRTHITFHLTQEYKVHHCSKCETSFASNWHLSKHVCQLNRIRSAEVANNKSAEEEDSDQTDNNNEATKAEEEVKCEKCGKVYMHIGWLEKHQAKCDKVKKEIEDDEMMDEEEENGVTNFKCDICLRVYSSPYWFETHKKKCNASTPTLPVVLPGKPTARCQLCGKVFQNERSLEFHMRHCRAKQRRLAKEMERNMDVEDVPVVAAKKRVEEVDEMAESGDEVIRRYTTRSRRRNSRTRNESIRNRVDSGGSDEEEEEEENEEEETEDDEEDKKEFQPQCSICGHLSTGVINLISHRRNAHGVDAMLTCGICGLKFNCLSSVTRHVNMEYSLYLCKKCGRNCHDSTVLRHHVCSTTCRPWNYHVGRRSAIIPRNVKIVAPTASAPAGTRRVTVIRNPTRIEQKITPKVVTVTTSLQKALLLNTSTAKTTTTTTPTLPVSSRHHQGNRKCPNCQETFATSFLLYNHRMACNPKRRDDRQPSTSAGSAGGSVGRTRTDTMRTVDSLDEQTIQCPECHEEFMYLREIAHHRHTVHGKQEFECVFCPKAFSLLRTLSDHHSLCYFRN